MSGVKDSLFLKSGATDSFAGTTSNLIRHFSSFDDTSNAAINSSATWVDLVGGNNAVCSGVTLDSTTKTFTTSAGSVINLGDVLGSGSDDQIFTTELWFKVASSKNESYVLGSASNVVTNGGFAMYIEGPGTNDDFGFAKYYNSGHDTARYVNVGSATTGVWHQYVYGFSGSTIYAWLDGSDITGGTYNYGSKTSASNTVKTNGANMYFGSFTGGTSSLIGEAGIIRIYDKILSNAEVLANWNADRAKVGL